VALLSLKTTFPADKRQVLALASSSCPKIDNLAQLPPFEAHALTLHNTRFWFIVAAVMNEA
jgi:hypothetical protein